jgi:hypothetical protein
LRRGVPEETRPELHTSQWRRTGSGDGMRPDRDRHRRPADAGDADLALDSGAARAPRLVRRTGTRFSTTSFRTSQRRMTSNVSRSHANAARPVDPLPRRDDSRSRSIDAARARNGNHADETRLSSSELRSEPPGEHAVQWVLLRSGIEAPGSPNPIALRRTRWRGSAVILGSHCRLALHFTCGACGRNQLRAAIGRSGKRTCPAHRPHPRAKIRRHPIPDARGCAARPRTLECSNRAGHGGPSI